MEGESASFADGVPDTFKQVGMVFDEITRSVIAASFLVTDHSQHDIARRSQVFRLGAHQGGHHHCHCALHVQCATAPEKAIGDLALEGRMGPHLALGCHDVDVSVHQ